MHTIHELAAQGVSLHQIARQLGLARNTVRKYVRGAAVPAARPPKPMKLDPFKDQIRHWVQQDHLLNCVTMLERLHPLGYTGGVSRLKAFVQPLRPPKAGQHPIRRYETAPGEQLQFDWGEFRYEQGGSYHKLFGFTAVLSYSRMRFVVFTKRCDVATLIQCIMQACDYFGGLPRTMLTDRMKTVLLQMDGSTPVWNDLFADFTAAIGVAPTSRFGAPTDFMAFVDHCHQHGIGLILDWVPAHFPKDAAGLGRFDGAPLYEHADPRQGEHQEWGTLIFNYGRNEVRSFLLSNALFWLDKYHIDGLRVDAVAAMLYLDYARPAGQWVPNRYGGHENLEAIEFIKQLNIRVPAEHPGVLTIAEESTAWPLVSRLFYTGGLGFSMKWNMGWMHDALHYMRHDPLYRRYSHGNITFSLQYAFSENYVLPLSHDEVVHLKGSLLNQMPGDAWQKFANLRVFYGFMYGHPGKKLLFMGGKFGVWREWDYDGELEWGLLDWPSHRGLQRYVQDLNRLYRAEPACYENDFDYHGFEWIDVRDSDNSVIAFLRRAHTGDELLIFVCNFTPVPRFDYRIGVPQRGYYREMINSDAAVYWGSNLGNHGGVWAEPFESHGRPYSLQLTLPPLSTLVLKPSEQPRTVSGSTYSEVQKHCTYFPHPQPPLPNWERGLGVRAGPTHGSTSMLVAIAVLC